MDLLRPRSAVLLAGLVALAACGSDGPVDPPAPDPASIVITNGDDQEGAANTAVAVAPQVRVLDDAGSPVRDVTVTFAVQSGGGTVTGATPKTSNTGYASVGSWTLGAAGGVNTLTATVTGLEPVMFSATGIAPTAAPANVVAYVGGGQTGQVSAPVAVPPTVRVTDAGGQPVGFASVTFSVQSGGGTVTGGTVTTDAQGLARPAAWTLGPSSGANTLRASVTGLAPVDFTATGVPLDGSRFNVSLRFLSGVTPAQLAVFEAARERWEDVITGELSNLTLSNQALCPTSYGTPAVTETIDEVVIFVKLEPIDGAGSVLGSAGPCSIRTSDGLPIAGFMRFDTADLSAMSESLFRDVILHEMGHVLGIGSLWNTTNPVRNLLTGAAGDDPYFVGVDAVAAFDVSGGSAYVGNKVPVENTGGTGTRDSHWREATLKHELMTGFVSSVNPNPLSAITVASLADMGYVVNPAEADPYTWTASLRMNAGEQRLTEEPLTGPILTFSADGRVAGSIERR